MKILRWAALAALAWATAAPAQIVSMPLSRAVECMTPPEAERGVPEYPAQELERKDGGTIRVELVFSAPDGAPAVRVLTTNAFSNLVDAVRAHVQKLRVPCLPPGGEPVRLEQQYVFRPGDARPVFAMAPVDLADAERDRQAACLMRITPGEHPEYPASMLRQGTEGSFLMRLRFSSPTSAPEISFLAGPPTRQLRASLQDFAQGYRLPCLRGEPHAMLLGFVFRIEGGERVFLKDMPLLQFLRLAGTLPPAQFDFGSMGCPFDLQITHYQPFAAHVVRQVGDARPERADFMRWIAGIPLRLSDNQAQELLASTFTLGVPCGRLDL
jgi:hypothetical protein